MSEIKVSALPVSNTLSANDRVVILTNTSSSANLKTISATNFANGFLVKKTTPVSNTANGTAGQIAYDNTYFYVCVANNKWGRASLELSW